MQCYEGIEASQVLYESITRQLLYARALHDGDAAQGGHAKQLLSTEFLLERPLLRAIRKGEGAVLLIDELDRADDEFDAFLLKLLSDFSVTIPEIGKTVTSATRPTVVITTNRTRELHDAPEAPLPIPLDRVPDRRTRGGDHPAATSRRVGNTCTVVAQAVSKMRELDLRHLPGAAEAIDWAQALAILVQKR